MSRECWNRNSPSSLASSATYLPKGGVKARMTLAETWTRRDMKTTPSAPTLLEREYVYIVCQSSAFTVFYSGYYSRPGHKCYGDIPYQARASPSCCTVPPDYSKIWPHPPQ